MNRNAQVNIGQRKTGETRTTETQRIIAGFYLVLMCIQYWPIEGFGTSMVKVSFMCLSPLILLTSLRPSGEWKVFVCCGACLFWKCCVAYFQATPFRQETLAYSVAFFLTYMMFYTLVYNGCFTLVQAQNLLKSLLIAYTAVLIIQQLYSLAGGGEWALMNLLFKRDYAMKCQSLSLEPSHSGRILGALFYALLKIWEYQKGRPVTIKDLWKNHRLPVICFSYAIISMQSATALFVLLLLLLYFFSWKYVLPLIVLFLLLPTLAEFAESSELKRVIAIMENSMTGDLDKVILADDSASFRVAPILNILSLELSDPHTWVGHGIDTGRNLILFDVATSRYKFVTGEILDIGLIGYILSLVLVFSCCIRPVFSLPMLMFFSGVGGSTGNVAYQWGILMIFTISSYFYTLKQHHLLGNIDERTNGQGLHRRLRLRTGTWQ